MECVDYCLARVLGKLLVAHNKLVQVVAQEVSACVAAVAVKNGKKLAFGPAVADLLRGLLDVQHNRDAVFVVVSNDSLVSVGRIGLDDAVLLGRALCLLVVRQLHIRNLQRILFGRLAWLACF